MFCLDTNVIIGVMTRRAPRLDERLRAELVYGSRLLVPAPVLAELRYGAAKSVAPERNIMLGSTTSSRPFPKLRLSTLMMRAPQATFALILKVAENRSAPMTL